MPAGNRDRDLQPVVEHRARADHRGPCVHEPASRRVTVAFHARQPDPVPVARHVERVRLADVGDPGTLRGRRDHAGPPGQPPPSGDRQVHLRSSPEYQLAAFGEPDDLARRSTHMRGHQASLGSGTSRRAPPDSGMARPGGIAVSSSWRDAGHRLWGWQPARAGPVPESGDQGSWGDPVLGQAVPGVSQVPALAASAAIREKRHGRAGLRLALGDRETRAPVALCSLRNGDMPR